ncbi:hypothetical protein [Pyrobaculum ferrireducens]|nr:hypothetical protein [Pyrobaculum ferrireducens]
MKVKYVTAVSVTFLLLVVATAFALWADVLKIHVETRTGNIDIQFDGTPNAIEYTEDTGTIGEYEGKDVAKCEAELVEMQNEETFASGAGLLPPTWNPSSGNNDLELHIAVSNAYPGYICKIGNIAVKNTGSVPVKVLVKIVDKDGNVIRPERYFGGFISYIDTDRDGCTELDLDFSSFFTLNGTQLHPGGSQQFTVNLRLPIERQECIKENTTYEFYIIIIGYQWNEYPH